MIAVIDYGMGNLGSIVKALEYVGGDVVLTSDAEKVREADHIVLPGVGAFGDGMKNLRALGLIPVLEEEVIGKSAKGGSASGGKKPFLGVCLGMQLLAKKSYEFGEHDGLGWINAEVEKLSPPARGGAHSEAGGVVGAMRGALKVPHVGWNNVTFTKEHPLLTGIGSGADFYFVHSYHMVPNDPSVVAGTVDYGSDVVAMIARDNIFATQFHPEKSQKDGLQILENFLHWNP